MKSQLLGELRFADSRGSGEQKASNGTIGLAESRARPLNGRGDGRHGFALSEDDALERFLR